MAITPDVIANYIANILGGSGSDAEKAATINAAARQYGVSREDINAATGYGMDQINAYLGPLSYAGSADDRQQDAIDAATIQPAETFQGGLSSIKSFADYYPTQGALPVSDTYTVDRYNPNDPASSHWIADANAGQWTFNDKTGERTLVPAGLTVDRYNPNDPESSRWIADPNAGQWTFNAETGERTLVPAGSTSGALSTVTAPASDVSITSRDAATVRPIGGSAAYQAAMAPGGIGIDAMNQIIRDFFAGNPDEATTRAAMQEFGVSEEDILRATGKSFGVYYPVGSLAQTSNLGAATTTGALGTDTVTGGLGSAAVKPVEAVGTYRGVLS